MSNTAASSAQLQECIVECDSCHDVCLEAIGYCLTAGGRCAEPSRVTVLMDCAEICQTAADFMLRGSSQHASICRVCADICDACAASCASLADAEMKACAEACRRCAAACRAMAE
jgi:hypothetical protein